MAGVDLPTRRLSPSPPAYKRDPRLPPLSPHTAALSLSSLHGRRAALFLCRRRRNSGRPSPVVGTSSEPGVATIRFAASSSSPSTPPWSMTTAGTTTTPTTRSSSPFLPHCRQHRRPLAAVSARCEPSSPPLSVFPLPVLRRTVAAPLAVAGVPPGSGASPSRPCLCAVSRPHGVPSGCQVGPARGPLSLFSVQ
jgi:hypothetical protein